MALEPPLQILTPWPEHLLDRFPRSPSATSVRSTSSTASSAAFSIDAPSSQSSLASGSTGWCEPTWLKQCVNLSCIERDDGAQAQENADACGFQLAANTTSKVVALQHRQHPRRTQRLCSYDSSTGVQAPLPPPTLVRQCERKAEFVDSLVDTTTQMVETIWPLSAHIQSRHPSMCTRQPSKMPLRQFVQEVLKRSKASYSTLQIALYYLILIRSQVPKHDFTHPQPEDSAPALSLQCGRRMFIASLILASKYIQDRNFSASGWSKISGLHTWDLNVNEMAFLKAIDWKLHFPQHLFLRWVDIVMKYSVQTHLPGLRLLPRPSLSWREIVLRVSPMLDNLDFDIAELSDDSGYCSPGSDSSGDMSPPPLPMRDQIASRSNDPTPTPTPTRSIPQWLEQTHAIKHTPGPTIAQRPTLPPLQPHLAPLPTPDLTPQSDPFCTPAVSMLGGSSRRSSMSRAMCQVQEAAHRRCVLDRTSDWKPRVPEGFPTLARRSSLATSASSHSSPDSWSDISSQYSDASSRPSRSSSISSAASSICAPAQSTRLAVQATRRCANMQLNNGLKDSTKLRTTPLHESPMEVPWQDENVTPRASKRSHESLREIRNVTQSFPIFSPPSTAPHNLPYSFDPPASEDHVAASALQDLALNSNRPRLQRTDTRKRARPNSMDLSVEDAVRNLIAPRCLTDITNTNARSSRENTPSVLSDEDIAESFLLRKENRLASREAHKRPNKCAKREMGKRAVAGSERGGRGSVKWEVEQATEKAQWDMT